MKLKTKLKQLLLKYKKNKVSINEVLEHIFNYPYDKLQESVLDIHREIRKGVPEIVYCQNKTNSQLIEIFTKLYKHNNFVIGTRLEEEKYNKIKFLIPKKHKYYRDARIIFLGNEIKTKKGNVLIITAGSVDIPVAKEAEIVCQLLGNRVKVVYDVGVAGLHRLNIVLPLIKKAKVIIVVAGMDGVLPSVIGGIAKVPVIAVPTSTGYGANFRGITPLLTMLNSCSPGVAVVNIDNGFGAGYLASMINKS
jgi:NCAIR mutase (PurE)-related protein